VYYVYSKGGSVRTTLAVLVASTAFATAGAPAAMAGSGNPSGTGPPNQTCQNLETSNILPSTGAGSSPGSVFNEPLNGSAGGTGGAAYNNAGAPSQYDVACYQTSLHH
jgi:hypothetical protein